MGSRLLPLFLMSLVACASAPPRFAPVPFPAAAIRDATHAGRTYVFRVEEAGKAPHMERIRFVKVDRDGAMLANAEWALDASPPADVHAEWVTWKELEVDSRFLSALTAITDAATDVPAGHFDCLLYTITPSRSSCAHPVVRRAWFAPALPGAPVRLELTSDDSPEPLLRMVLVEYIPE